MNGEDFYQAVDIND